MIKNIIKYQSRFLYSVVHRQKSLSACISINNCKMAKKIGNQRFINAPMNESIHKKLYSSSTVNKDIQDFSDYLPIFLKDVTNKKVFDNITEVSDWFTNLLEYNIATGNKLTGTAVVTSYKMLENPEKLTPENLKPAYILGWCLEMIRGSNLIKGDIVEERQYQQGLSSWHTKKDVGAAAYIDAFLLESSAYKILNEYFKDHQYFIFIIELFHDIYMKTCIGQTIDSFSAVDKKLNLDLYTMDRFNEIAKHKIGYFNYYMPCAISMYLTNIIDSDLHHRAESILLEIGNLNQAQNDYLDCYGDPKKIEKPLMLNIIKGKCSWLIVTALEKASPVQKQLIQNHFGSMNPEDVQIINNLFDELNLKTHYKIYKEEKCNFIRSEVEKLKNCLPPDLFLSPLEILLQIEN